MAASNHAPPRPARPSDLAESLRAALEEQDWTRLRSLYHPDARIATVLSRGRPLGADESVGAIRAAVEAGTYASDWMHMEDLDEHAVLTIGGVRTSPDEGRVVRQTCWVSTFRDGLVYRTVAFASVPEALRAYRDLGVELGIPDL